VGQRQRCIKLASHVRQVNNIKEKLMIQKPHAVALRLEPHEYDALVHLQMLEGDKNLGITLRRGVNPLIAHAAVLLAKANKSKATKAERLALEKAEADRLRKAEAKAKRLAKKEAQSGL
jgi:hypothetical protein